ncbi:ABC transporter permease [Paraflavitalea sp. CAU 1676]|uniref:ABC transporter permease n=1 Tax=Paraflavitalea sp. CAU 1676 TaxID=3032598 RepID=UPI0023DCCCF4|nr:ABC transporter permease [Paraflavitalea sp. CAU 1676]MDF2192020.1 ABC transporter permease [Paraflavitalea sp. CAU 1676]
MFKNYLKTAWRNLWKNKTMAFINILGLMTGITCCLLIGLYIQHEYSYDRFQQKGDRITRVLMDYKFSSGDWKKVPVTSTKVLPVFATTFPEVENGVRMTQLKRVVAIGDKQFEEKRFMFADSTFFNLFSFKLLEGDQRQALSGLNKVILTTATAQKYFGTQNPVGKLLKIGSSGVPYEVTGILPNCPSNSQMQFDFLASFSSLEANQVETWWNANYTTFLLLKDKAGMKTMQPKVDAYMEKDMAGKNASVRFILEPFNDIHLRSEFDSFEPNTNIAYLYILTGVAVLILVIACFTYVNLSTARSLDRGREVGIRKAIGALRQQIFRQFLSESLLLSVLAVLLSLAMVIALLPAFNRLAGTELTTASLFTPVVGGFILLIIVCISLLAGSYPALVLSSFQPIKVLKGSLSKTGSRGAWLHKTLIVFQFGISVFLVVGTMVIHQQMRFIQDKKLGYDRDHVLVLPWDNKMNDIGSTIKQELAAIPGIQSVSRTGHLPTTIAGGYNMRTATMPESDNMSVIANPIDEDYLPTMNIKLLAGSNLSRQDIIDVSDDQKEGIQYHFLLNESAAKALGWTAANAVGQRMFLDGGRPGVVKGVMEDFHFQSLHKAIQPLVLFPSAYSYNLLVKVNSANLPQTIGTLQQKWKQLVAHRPFDYHFLDEDYNKMYQGEQRLSQIMNLFAAIAIGLACMGLFGLSYHAMQQRRKEIGIRKVLGATVPQILLLVSKGFMKLVLIAFAITVPATWWAMQRWLEDFAYRTSVGWILFGAAGVIVLAIAAGTVSFQAIRAALSNPVKSLRSE